MTENELKQILKDYHVDPQYYSFDGGLPENRLTMDKFDDGYHVYWVEHHYRGRERIFADKSDALEYFGWYLLGKLIALRRGHDPLLRAHSTVFERSFGDWNGPGTLQRAIDTDAGWPSVYRQYPISGRLSHLFSRIAMVQFR